MITSRHDINARAIAASLETGPILNGPSFKAPGVGAAKHHRAFEPVEPESNWGVVPTWLADELEFEARMAEKDLYRYERREFFGGCSIEGCPCCD